MVWCIRNVFAGWWTRHSGLPSMIEVLPSMNVSLALYLWLGIISLDHWRCRISQVPKFLAMFITTHHNNVTSAKQRQRYKGARKSVKRRCQLDIHAVTPGDDVINFLRPKSSCAMLVTMVWHYRTKRNVERKESPSSSTLRLSLRNKSTPAQDGAYTGPATSDGITSMWTRHSPGRGQE